MTVTDFLVVIFSLWALLLGTFVALFWWMGHRRQRGAPLTRRRDPKDLYPTW